MDNKRLIKGTIFCLEKRIVIYLLSIWIISLFSNTGQELQTPDITTLSHDQEHLQEARRQEEGKGCFRTRKVMKMLEKI